MKGAPNPLSIHMCHNQRIAVNTVQEEWNYLPPEVNFNLGLALLFNWLFSFEQSTLPGLVSISLSISNEKPMTI